MVLSPQTKHFPDFLFLNRFSQTFFRVAGGIFCLSLPSQIERSIFGCLMFTGLRSIFGGFGILGAFAVGIFEIDTFTFGIFTPKLLAIGLIPLPVSLHYLPFSPIFCGSLTYSVVCMVSWVVNPFLCYYIPLTASKTITKSHLKIILI